MTGVIDIKELIPGRHIVLEVKSGATFQGNVFCFDESSGALVLEESSENSTLKKDVRVVQTNSVTTIKYGEKSAPTKPSFSLEQLKKQAETRQREAELAAKRAIERIGKDVTPEGQKLFDRLSRTLECRWSGKNIQELKLQIIIQPPYKPENVHGKDQGAVDRVKKMITHIMQDA